MWQLILITWLAGLLVACGTSTAPKVAAPQTDPIDPQETSSLNEPNDPQIIDEPDLSEITSGALIDAKYNMAIDVIGIGVCNGELEIKVDPILGAGGKMFDMPKACLDCMGMKIDMAQAMGGFTGGGQTGIKPPKPEIKDDVIFLSDMGPIKSSPARPLFPSFLAGDPDDLKRLNVSRRVTITNETLGESGTGTIGIETMNFGRPYSSPYSHVRFDKTMAVALTANGFDTMKMKLMAMLFERAELVVSLDPVAIPRLYAEFEVGEMMQMQQDGGLDPTQMSGNCGTSSAFSQMLVNMSSGDGGLVGSLGGMLGGGGGGDNALGGILGTLVGEIVKKLKIKVNIDLIEMEGLEDDRED